MSTYQYFFSYENYFWQWEDEGEVLAIPGGNTIAYKTFILDIFQRIYLQGIPPFGSLLLAIIATNNSGKDDIETVMSVLQDKPHSDHLDDAKAFLNKLAALPVIYKQGSKRILLLKSIFEKCHNIISVKDSNAIFKNFSVNKYAKGNFPAKKTLDNSIIFRDLKTIAVLNKKFETVEDIINLMVSVPTIDEPIILPYDEVKEERESEKLKDFTDLLTENEKTFHIGSLIKRIRSGLNIAMHSVLPSEQPLGGVSDLTNKGDFDKLLISEFANDDIVFLSRLANNEALYIRREVPPVHNNLERIFLLDISLRNWGTPKTMAFAIMLAIAKHPKTDIAGRAFVTGNSYTEITFETVHDIIEAVQLTDAEPDAANGISSFFRDNPPNRNREVFFISDAAALKRPQIMKALTDNHAGIHYLIETDAAGNIDIFKKQQQSKRHLQHLLLPLEELWKKTGRAAKKNIPDIIVTQEYPILFPFVKRNRYALFEVNNDIFLITKQKRLFRFFQRSFKPSAKGWQLMMEDLPFKNEELSFGISEKGDYILLVINIPLRELKLINLSLGQSNSIFFGHVGPESNIEAVFFYDNSFHCYTAHNYWIIGLDGKVEKQNSPSLLISEKKMQQLQLFKNFNYTLSVFKNIQVVFINTDGKLSFNQHELFYKKDHVTDIVSFTVNTTAEKLIKAKRIKEGEFEFPNGSKVIVNTSGVLILQNNIQSTADIFIVSSTDSWSAFATESAYAGTPYFIKEKLFDIILKNGGPKKISVIKIVKESLETGLREAKALVDSEAANSKVFTGNRRLAEQILKKLTDEGADAEITASPFTATVHENIEEIKPSGFYDSYIQPFINDIQSHGA